MLVSAAAGLLLAGCASFPAQPPQESWQPQPRLTPQAGPQPQAPGQDSQGIPGKPGQPKAPTSVPPPNGCKDFDPAVIATCLSPISAVAVLPGGDPASGAVKSLAAERTTGRILQVAKGAEPIVLATVPVDATGDGGLTGLSLSPTYGEDQLIFAYVTTATDNRVLRIAPGDQPKPVLTGIPKGATGNQGVLTTDRKGALLLATGDGGKPDAAADPNSLSGKVLRIDTSGKPAKDNPTANSPVVASGLHSPGGICTSLDGTRTWVTDRVASGDLLYAVKSGQALGTAAWTWPDRPGVTGCAAYSDMITVATAKNPGMQSMHLNQDGSFKDKPQLSMQDDKGFGLLGALDLVDEQYMIGGTVNKAGGKPVSSDDRVVILVRPDTSGGGGGGD
ncbi:glucose dehydrogenase [Solihabitans fulvus]|uniref:Glucose dehydrogenase n=1 Tax=Solihabitans fulvus TaxID=1892852 RepID=A0A5B2WT95_9PSEU|nr:glucose dehydrogenase [Solihabitans fulvus]